MNHNYKLSRFFAWQSKQKSREGIAQYLLRYANVYELESGLMILSHSPPTCRGGQFIYSCVKALALLHVFS